SETPFVTMLNGQSGVFADQALSPFVIGFVPVVGGFANFGDDVQPPLALPAWQSKLNAGQQMSPSGGASQRAARNAGRGALKRPAAEEQPADPWVEKLAVALAADAPPADVAEVKRRQHAA